MRNLILALCFLYVQPGYTQKLTLVPLALAAEWPKSNAFRLVCPGIPGDQLVLQCNNGKVVMADDKIYFSPLRLKETTFFMYRKTGNKTTLIDSLTIPVIPNRDIRPYFGTRFSGPISKTLIQNIGGLAVRMFVNDYHSEPVAVSSFRITIFQENRVESVVNTGSRFTDATKALIEKLHTKDRFIITEILASFSGFNSLQVQPGEFVIE